MNTDVIEELKERDLLIDPRNIDRYLRDFPDFEREMEQERANLDYWKDRRVLITGVSGFVGSHLAEKLVALGSDVTGLVRRHSVPEYPNIRSLLEKMRIIEGNLQDLSSLVSLLRAAEPEVIFHLGAQSFVPTSFRCPVETYTTNVLGTANIMEALRLSEHSLDAIQVACSSEEYGKVYPDEIPIDENNPLRPQSPYAVSKVATEMIARNYCEAYGIPSIITRGFNHTGPRRGLQFVTSVITRQVAAIKMGIRDSVVIGNATAVRDFTDVRDMVLGYILAVEKGRKGEAYNLGHGKGISIGDLIQLAGMMAGLDDVRVEVDETRYRPLDVDILICDCSKAHEELGYAPRIPLTKAVKDNLQYFIDNPNLTRLEMH